MIKSWETAWAEFVPFLEFPTELRHIVYTTNAIVIWSHPKGVLYVVDGHLYCLDLRAGRGYLQWSSMQVSGRFGVRATGGDARLAA